MMVFLSCALVKAQESGIIMGYLTDSLNPHVLIRHAEVRLVSDKDTLSVITGLDSPRFSFKDVNPGRKTLIVNSGRYKPYEMEYDIASGYNILYIKLDPLEEVINAASVVARIPLSKQVGDTTRYFAAAIHTKDNDDAIELLSSLPDFSVEGGRIYHMGEPVNRTYVNGVLLFGDNPVSAFNHIEAQQVTSIDAYREESSEDKLKGLKSPAKVKVLNIKTKNPIVSSIDIAAALGGGVDGAKNESGKVQGRYLAGVTGNFYSEMFLFDINFFMNNIGKNDNSINLLRILEPSPLRQYTEKIHLSSGLTKYWKDRFYGNKVSLRYTFDKDYGSSSRQVQTDYFPTADNPSMSKEERHFASSVNGVHKVTASIAAPQSFMGGLSLYNKLLIENGDAFTSNAMTGNLAGAIIKNETQKDIVRNWSDQLSFSWKANRNADKLSPYVTALYSFGRNSDLSWVTDTTKTSTLTRNLESNRAGRHSEWSVSAGVEKSIYNKKNGYVTLNGWLALAGKKTNTVKASFNNLDPDNPIPDYANTYNHTRNQFSQSAGIKLVSSFRKMNLSSSFTFNHFRQNDSEQIPLERRNTKDYFDFTPSIDIHLPDVFHFSLSTYSLIPTVEQIRNWIDDSNPYVLQVGNPDLKAPYVVYLSGLWFFSALDGFFAGDLTLDYTETFSPITTRRTLFQNEAILSEHGNYTVPKGAFLMSYQNAGNSRHTGLSSNLIYLTKNRNWKLSAKVGLEYTQSSEYLSDNLAVIYSPGVTFSPGVRYTGRNKLSMVAKITGRVNWHFSSATTYLPTAFRISPQFRIAKQFSRVNISAQYKGDYSLYSSDVRPLYLHDLSAMVSVFFLNKTLALSVSAGDILSRATVRSVTTGTDSIISTITPSYGRYFMLGVTYRFRKHNGKSFMGPINQGNY